MSDFEMAILYIRVRTEEEHWRAWALWAYRGGDRNDNRCKVENKAQTRWGRIKNPICRTVKHINNSQDRAGTNRTDVAPTASILHLFNKNEYHHSCLTNYLDSFRSMLLTEECKPSCSTFILYKEKQSHNSNIQRKDMDGVSSIWSILVRTRP